MVWPTRKETQKYFSLVLTLLTFFAIYLFLVSNIFSEIVFTLKNTFGNATPAGSSSSLTDEEIDALFSNEATLEQIEDTSTGSVEQSVSGTGGQ